MQRAQTKDASRKAKFHFRRQVFPYDRPQTRYDLNSRPVSPPTSRRPSPPMSPISNGHARAQSAHSTRCSTPAQVHDEDEDGPEMVEMTMDEVINGRGDGATFPGLLGVVNAYLNSLNVDVVTKCELRRYLDLVKWRARGMSTIHRPSHVVVERLIRLL